MSFETAPEADIGKFETALGWPAEHVIPRVTERNPSSMLDELRNTIPPIITEKLLFKWVQGRTTLQQMRYKQSSQKA